MAEGIGGIAKLQYRKLRVKTALGEDSIGSFPFEDMAAFNSNEHHAFAKVYDRLFPYVFYFTMRFVSSEDAEDITGDVFYKLWKMDKKFTCIKTVKSWLQVSARNACLTRFEHDKVVERAHRSILVCSKETTEEHDFDSYSVRYTRLNNIYAAIEKLPAQQKEIFVLSCLRGLKEKQIASRLGLSVHTVHTHKGRALKKLRLSLLGFCSLLFTQLCYFGHAI